jgi:predicted acetyltransferase
MKGEMNPRLRIFSADTPADLTRLRAFVAARGAAALSVLERHLVRPRYQPAWTRIAERAGQIAGYALIGHERLRLGTATLEAGRIAALELSPADHDPHEFAALLGDCLRVLIGAGLPLALVRGSAATYTPFGFAAYHFSSAAEFWQLDHAHTDLLRPVVEDDLEDLAALYESSYGQLALATLRAAPDWRHWLAHNQMVLGLEDSRSRLVAYALLGADQTHDPQIALEIDEAAAADAGAARSLCAALLGRARKRHYELVHLTLSPQHIVAQTAMQLGGNIWIECPKPTDDMPLAGIVDLPLLLEALAPEFERRLARSRYVGWSGNLRMETETERITLAFAEGRATVIDGARPADLRLRQITLPALAQLCLGYRVAADLRATGELACDDSALGLLDALFPAVLATGAAAEC